MKEGGEKDEAKGGGEGEDGFILKIKYNFKNFLSLQYTVYILLFDLKICSLKTIILVLLYNLSKLIQ